MPETIIELEKHIRFAERLIKRSKHIFKQNGIDVYKIPLIKSVNLHSTFERLIFGNANPMTKEHRSILVLGANCSSKDKFINGIINYVFNVEEEDKFRFQLTEKEETNHTNYIKIYEIHHVKGFRIHFSLTIVSMPIFISEVNDSELFRYQTIAKLFYEFLEDESGIQELDMVCNVIIETNSNNQSYIPLFGNDIVESINYCHPSDYMSNSSWQKLIQQCFTELVKKETKSLSLTREVLSVRNQMSEKVNGLQFLINIGHCKMEEIDKAKQMLLFCETHIESNDEEDEDEFTEKVKLPLGIFVSNCNRCCITCHHSFVKEEKVENSSINGDFYKNTSTVFCPVCPDNCSMNMHSSQTFRGVYVKQETQNLSNQHTNRNNDGEIKWKDLKSKGRCLIEVLQNDLVHNSEVMLEHFQTIWKLIKRLNKIALYRNSFLTQRVFNIIFDAEQQLKKQGFLKDVF